MWYSVKTDEVSITRYCWVFFFTKLVNPNSELVHRISVQIWAAQVVQAGKCAKNTAGETRFNFLLLPQGLEAFENLGAEATNLLPFDTAT